MFEEAAECQPPQIQLQWIRFRTFNLTLTTSFTTTFHDSPHSLRLTFIMNSCPFSIPRTPKGYKHVAEPPSPLARFDQKGSKELPSLRIWKETCKVRNCFLRLCSNNRLNEHVSKVFNDTTNASDASVRLNSPSVSGTSETTPPLERSYKPFRHLMLLDDLDAESDDEFCDSFNVFATKRLAPARGRNELKGSGQQPKARGPGRK